MSLNLGICTPTLVKLGAQGTELYTSTKTLMNNFNTGVDATEDDANDADAWVSSIPFSSTLLRRGKSFFPYILEPPV